MIYHEFLYRLGKTGNQRRISNFLPTAYNVYRTAEAGTRSEALSF
jgi:hypothetical protein